MPVFFCTTRIFYHLFTKKSIIKKNKKQHAINFIDKLTLHSCVLNSLYEELIFSIDINAYENGFFTRTHSI